MSSATIDLGSISKSFKATGKKVLRFRVPLFLVVVLGLYGFLVFRTYSLMDIAPDSTVESTAKTSRAHIDEDVAKKIQELQDNSVNVQKVFNDARNNPFQE